jgi:biopolymer transport protein ExbD
MRFTVRKRRNPPAVIIVSLIDVLIVVLIFLMVATTFKQQPAVKLALPESKQDPKPGASDDNLVVTVAKEEPHLYLGTRPLTLDKLQQELKLSAAKNPQITLSIRGDTDAPWGQIMKVIDAAKAAGVKGIQAFVKPPSQP